MWTLPTYNGQIWVSPYSFASDDVKNESLILASSTDGGRATLIKVWSHCQIAFRSLWMPELLLPQPSPDYSISQSHCWLKIRWRIHAVQPYLNLAHTLRSMGFHYKFLPCTPGMTQLMWEFAAFSFHFIPHQQIRWILRAVMRPFTQIFIWKLKYVCVHKCSPRNKDV